MSFRDRFTDYFSQGDTLDFYECLTCAARITKDGRELHDEWHKSIEPNAAHPVTRDRFARLLKVLDSD